MLIKSQMTKLEGIIKTLDDKDGIQKKDLDRIEHWPESKIV